MQTEACPTAGLGHADGSASVMAAPLLKFPNVAITVSRIREFFKHPLPLADGVSVVPEHAPAVAANGLSDVSPLATACLAPWRAASATVEVAQSTRKTSRLSARMKQRRGKTSANCTRAWPRV